MSFPRYSKYIGIGVESLGEVPEHCPLRQRRYVPQPRVAAQRLPWERGQHVRCVHGDAKE